MCDTITTPRLLTACCMALALSGCASGFVSGGIATASGSGGRVDIDSRVATARIGPAGPSAEATQTSGSVCVNQSTGAVSRC